ncbi:GNAT family N-acetyltransferase [Devosia sp. YIM 151766]|uniref:GNAT family N-acetyltransferase n=1 Tax=Devosia sp. YIM 151766 TaxID=3017325 RepID=UPI00255CE2A9|nr:GNAT family N-acetyltransferase [Devosia sp. YIM 151766]WIY53488.1 GNAT family N-acetyltransferase [Devosia sp. YIM 151766]
MLRLPQRRDYDDWYRLRRTSQDFLRPFEPRWSELDLARRVYSMRVRHARQEAEAGTDYTFFIFLPDRRKEVLVGGITLSNIRRRAAQFVNLGYWMGQEYAGQGLMSEAVSVTLPFIFQTLDLHRVHAAFLPHNLASRRVLEKNGFVEEGYAKHYLQINGRWEDHVLMGLTREHWETWRLGMRFQHWVA